jgi:hypothetical protein
LGDKFDMTSTADQQGGDFGMTARFSRIGLDTRTLTDGAR